MKKILLFTIATLCLCTSLYAQTIRRVNNNAGVTGVNVYTTIQAAHDAASNGDIIYVEPSNSSYGDLVSTKTLTIYGSGYFLSENQSVTGVSVTLPTIVGNFIFNTGSQNSRVYGLNMFGANILASSILIDRCTFRGSIGLGTQGGTGSTPPISVASNTVISRCFSIYGVATTSHYYNTGSGQIIVTPSGLFTNCSISGPISNVNNCTFNNSVFIYSSPVDTPVNCSFSNNIFLSGYAFNISGSTFNHNFSSGNFLPSTNGNVNNIDQNTIFITGLQNDNIYKLNPSGPVTNAGMFNGATPYLPSGIPPIPLTTNLTTSGSGNASTPLQVSITVRGNN